MSRPPCGWHWGHGCRLNDNHMHVCHYPAGHKPQCVCFCGERLP